MSTVLVTGGASGLGKEICLTFQKNGYTVLFTYNKTNPSSELKDCHGYQCDLSSEDAIKSLLYSIYSEYKNIDVLINNAAIEINKDISSRTKKDFLNTLEVNLVAPFWHENVFK